MRRPAFWSSVFGGYKVKIFNMIKLSALKRLCGIYGILAIVVLAVNGCGGKTSQWVKTFNNQLRITTADQVVTDQEFKSLSGFIKTRPAGALVDGKEIATEDDLVALLVDRGITGDAQAIVSRLVTAPFSELRIMLENSASMTGYTGSGNPSFTAPIIALFNGIDKDTEVITGYVHDKGNDQCEYQVVETGDFQKDLANGKIQTATSSPIDQILGLIAENANDSTVTALITDGIVSGTNQEILSTLPARDWTIKNIPLIEQRVRTAASLMKEKDQDFILMRFETEFKGDYYNYKNLRENFKTNIVRPYFIILIGRRNHLAEMCGKLVKENNFRPTHILCSYASDNIPTVAKGLLTVAPAPGMPLPKVKIDNAGTSIKFKKPLAYPFTFKCRVILSADVVSKYNDVDFIKENLKFEYKDLMSGAMVDKAEMIYDVTGVPGQPNAYDICIQADADFVNSISGIRQMHLFLPVVADSWYKDFSVSDDTEEGWDTSNTFHLDTFVDGFIKGFDMDNNTKSLIDIKINLKK